MAGCQLCIIEFQMAGFSVGACFGFALGMRLGRMLGYAGILLLASPRVDCLLPTLLNWA